MHIHDDKYFMHIQNDKYFMHIQNDKYFMHIQEDKYVIHIQDDNKLITELMEEMGKLEQCFLTATRKEWRVGKGRKKCLFKQLRLLFFKI